jgi:hypothetical protein
MAIPSNFREFLADETASFLGESQANFMDFAGCSVE